MIASLSGKLLQRRFSTLLIEVFGVGYEVQLVESDQKKLPLLGEKIFLWTYLSIKETQWNIFGFFSMQKRDLFKHLLAVNGMGPKLALSCVSALEPRELVEIIESQSLEKLQEVPGIGRKMAARLIVELSSVLKKIETVAAQSGELKSVSAASPNRFTTPLVDDAIRAMRQLGYKDELSLRKIAKEAFQDNNQLDIQSLLKLMLQRCDLKQNENFEL